MLSIVCKMLLHQHPKIYSPLTYQLCTLPWLKELITELEEESTRHHQEMCWPINMWLFKFNGNRLKLHSKGTAITLTWSWLVRSVDVFLWWFGDIYKQGHHLCSCLLSYCFSLYDILWGFRNVLWLLIRWQQWGKLQTNGRTNGRNAESVTEETRK